MDEFTDKNPQGVIYALFEMEKISILNHIADSRNLINDIIQCQI